MSILINSPVVKGNGNSVVINRDSSSDIQWDRLEKECFQALQQLPSNCDENKAVKEVLADAIHCDETNLKATVKKYAAALSSGLFTSVAGTFLAEFIKNILHM